jgi:hypothetical protein
MSSFLLWTFAASTVVMVVVTLIFLFALIYTAYDVCRNR